MSNDHLIQLSQIGNILSNIGNKLIQNQILLKCLAYDSEDALSQPDLGIQDIIELIGKGDNPRTQQKVFKVPFNKNIVEEAHSELRFFLPSFNPNNLYLSEVLISFQIIVYNNLWELSNNQMRPFIMINEILKDFNGYDINSIGELKLNVPIRIITWNSEYSGYEINFSTRTK